MYLPCHLPERSEQEIEIPNNNYQILNNRLIFLVVWNLVLGYWILWRWCRQWWGLLTFMLRAGYTEFHALQIACSGC